MWFGYYSRIETREQMEWSDLLVNFAAYFVLFQMAVTATFQLMDWVRERWGTVTPCSQQAQNEAALRLTEAPSLVKPHVPFFAW